MTLIESESSPNRIESEGWRFDLCGALYISGLLKEEEALKDNPESLKGDFLAENKHPVIDTGVIQEPNGT